jgi:flagellar biosynthesis protein FlhB
MSEHSSGRHLPPSTARLAAAASAGMFPRTPLLALGAALVALAAVLGFGGDVLGRAVAGLVRDGLGTAALVRPDPEGALVEALSRGAAIAAPVVLAPAAAALIAAIVPALWARRHGRGSTAAPLPETPPRTPERAILIAAAVAVVALAAAHGFTAVRPALARLPAEGGGAMADVVAAIASSIFVAGIALLVAGLADLALQRVRLLEALALTRSEAQREDGAGTTARRVRAEQLAEARRRITP